ncbi:hypothetical protein PG996_001385 [Apiospora saccharicola]|uniref:DNA-binding protein n=1 Tax=Apiospora saccharicola TaxID=335842 RepID=A0ABR1WGG9_9PEZI
MHVTRLRLVSWYSTSLRRLKRTSGPDSGSASNERNEDDEIENEVFVPCDDDYPVIPPPPPSIILEDPPKYLSVIQIRKFATPRGFLKDTSRVALYRLYELIVLDLVLDYRNCLEAFWRKRDWPAGEIADPADDVPVRYAFLAGCTYLLARSFNQRVKLGLDRNMPALMVPEEAEAARNVPEHLRKWEEVPQWAKDVLPLSGTYVLPTRDGELLESKQDKRADPDLAKNILLWTPHIFFT